MTMRRFSEANADVLDLRGPGAITAGPSPQRTGPQRTGDEDDVAGDTSTEGLVVLDGTTTGTLETADDHDWFAVDLTAGQRLEVTLAMPQNAVSFFRFAGPDGTAIYGEDTALRFDAAGDEVWVRSLIAPTDGTYYVTLAYTQMAPYEYAFSSRLVDDDWGYVGGWEETAFGALTVGETATGTVDYYDDWDSFLFEVEAHRGYEVIVRDASGGEGIVNVDVTSPDNAASYGGAGGGGEARLDFSTEEAGTLAVNVSGAFGSLPDGYTVQVVAIPIDDDDYGVGTNRGTLTVGTPIFGRFDYAGDRDEFALSGVAGQIVRIRLFDGLDAPSDDILNDPPTLYGPDGERVTWMISSDYEGFGYARLTETGTYTVAVQGSPEPSALGTPHGEYALVAEVRDSYAVPTSLSAFLSDATYAFSPLPDVPARDPDAIEGPSSLSLNDWPDPLTSLNGERRFVVAADETLEMGGGPMLFGDSNAYFQNDGAVWVIGGGYVGRGNNWERFVNNGDVVALAPSGAAVWRSGGSGLLENAGTITVVSAEGSAEAVSIHNPSAIDGETYESLGWTSVNTGTIRVWAGTGDATGFATFSDQREPWNSDAPTLDNQGDLIVQGLSGAYAVSMAEGGGLTNSGRIVAVSDFAGTSFGVVSGVNIGGLRVVNDGLISADVSVYGATFGGGYALAEIVNGGTMEGDVRLEGMQAVIENAGEMVGDLYLGDADDAYRGADGTLAGAALMGGGDDEATGGEAADTLFGEAGDDVLIGGGGGDWIEGGSGADVIYGDGGPA